MARKKVDRIEKGLKVIDINAKGMGVAKNDEGVVYFIKDVIPGDVVDVQVYKKGRRYFEAKPIQWITKSPHSTTPPCDYFGVCGGCKLQHLSYEGQLEYKEKGVLHNLNNIGKIDIGTVLPIAGVENPYYYRNKMEFSFSNKRWLTTEEIAQEGEIQRNGLGFHKPGMWDKVVDIDHCHLQADPSNEIRNTIRSFAIKEKLDFFDTREQQGFLRTLMIRNTLGGEVMVLIQFFKEDQEKRELLLNFLKDQFPQITSLLYCINDKGNDSLYDQNIVCYYGQDFITEHLGDLQFKITAKSFYQTNPKQAETLYAIGKEFADLKGNEIVYDLYTGTGTIALSLAKQCAKVIGIESVPEAIEAARENAVFNQIENAFFEVGDMKDCFNDSFVEQHGKADVVITDPPRNGMHADVIKQLLKLAPPRIVYISCNSSTQARDLELMKEAYTVLKSQAVDMFPQTHHVENVVLLQRNDIHE
jgi:23S rRNA (uracil1939-C5)-methyltransferase